MIESFRHKGLEAFYETGSVHGIMPRHATRFLVSSTPRAQEQLMRSKYKGMHNPAHPGEVFRDGYLAPQGLTQAKVATLLGVSRKTVSELVNAKAPVTAEMALRIALVFGTDAAFWLRMQANWDAWQVQQREAEIRQQITPWAGSAA